jgi:PAS domain S-box-containing protein
MEKKNKSNPSYFKNKKELIVIIQQSLLYLDDEHIFRDNKDEIDKIIGEILYCIEKDLEKALNEKHPKIIHLIRSIQALLGQNNSSTTTLQRQVKTLTLLRRVFTLKRSLLKADETTESDILTSLWNVFDHALLNLCIHYESEISKTILREDGLIEKHNIVKNDLQKQLNALYQLIKNAPIGMAGCDTDLKVKLWNPAAVNLTGYQQADIIAKSILTIFSHPSQTILKDQFKHEHCRLKQINLNIQTKEGGIFNALVLIKKLNSEIRQKIQYIINFIDLSKDDKLKSQLGKIEQLGAVARLSDAIMHDVRNPINSLALNIDVLAQRLTGNTALHDIFEKINRQITTLSRNLKQYVGYSKITELQLEPIDIGEVMEELTLDTYHQLSGRPITVNYHRAKSKLMIKGDRNQLNRVFRNLLDNAIDAIGEVGTIDIYLKKSNKNVTISIMDNGRGIDEENLQNVFKPYFTTKERGSGLGLFIVQEIIRAHNGKINCKANKNQGTVFTVNIPAFNE